MDHRVLLKIKKTLSTYLVQQIFLKFSHPAKFNMEGNKQKQSLLKPLRECYIYQMDFYYPYKKDSEKNIKHYKK